MKVTIMLTSYNLVDCIDTSIDSVIQMEKPFEWSLLIGDDGSTDGTVDRINQWIEKYPNNIFLYTLSRDENVKSGKRAAMNRANLLEKADGDYLIYLDGDDQFLGCDKLKKQVSLLESEKYRHCSGCAHNIIANRITEGTKRLMVNESIQERTFTAHEYWPSMYFHTNTILFRKECKELMLKPYCRENLNDNFITFCILQYGDLLYIPDAFAQYNLTGNGLWTGSKKVYGCFRNMMLYDLELQINNSLRKESFVRHLYDFNVIRKHYKQQGQDNVDKLLENENPKIYPHTFFLYKKEGMTIGEKFRMLFLKIKVLLTINKLRVLRLIKIIKK